VIRRRVRPIYGPLVADLAPPELTSRYMAFSGFSWQLGFIVGPGLGALLLGAAGSGFWLAPAAACLLAGAAALRLEARLPAAVRRTPR
jgi:MFS family permease